jgi:Kef-type K+ transport system membrane component KefB
MGRGVGVILLEISSFLDPGAQAGGEEAIARAVLWLAVILVLAKLGGEIAARLGQPQVLGELAVGIVIGNLALLGFHHAEGLRDDVVLNLLARIGVLILMFKLGLRSSISRMVEVGLSSLLVAAIGVAVPFVLGFLASAWLLPESGPHVHAFLAATLTATGILVIGRVLSDLGRSETREARVILGAAVIDDLLGLTIMAVVDGAIASADRGTPYSWGSIAQVGVRAILFLGGSLVLGTFLSPRLFSLASRFRSRGVLLAWAVSFSLFFAYLASRFGLSPVIGAFAAGLILEKPHYRKLLERGEHPLEESLEPVTSLLVPVFFVLMGMRIELVAFAEPGILALTALLTLAAVAGKLACSLGVLERGIDRLSVGIGMVPRGALGLVFANMGLSLTIGGKPIITPPLMSAVVLMVFLTTFVALPALEWRLDLIERRRLETLARAAAAAKEVAAALGGAQPSSPVEGARRGDDQLPEEVAPGGAGEPGGTDGPEAGRSRTGFPSASRK